MRRAVVLIGVSKPGGLPALHGVESGIARMRCWAAGQGIDGDRLVVLTDKMEKVRAYQIADSIAQLIQRQDIDQLIVYFTGHGIHNRGDIWLLSGAPSLASEAVNVEGSVEAARSCGVSHVVFISDACRTAAEGIQGLNIDGIDIFPNDPLDGKERPVDLYFACARGKPALEVSDPVVAAREFSGIYTDVLVDCLIGKYAGALNHTQENGIDIAHVRAWDLADQLQTEVPKHLRSKLGRIPTVNQTPVARITSRSAWISRLTTEQLAANMPDESVDVLGHQPREYSNAIEAANWMLREALSGNAVDVDDDLLGSFNGEETGAAQYISMFQELASPFRPLSAPLTCAIRVRGAQVFAAYSASAVCTVVEKNRLVALNAIPQIPSILVLVELHDGASVLVPVIPGFIVELTFKGEELVQLDYEPTSIVSLHGSSAANQVAARALRASVAVATGMGVLRLDHETVLKFSDAAMNLMPNPTLGLYFAYACQELGLRKLISPLQKHLKRALGFSLFDVALLSGQLAKHSVRPDGPISPPVPMLSRNWSLLRALNVELHPELNKLQSALRPSLWTVFSPAGTRQLVQLIRQETIK